MLPIFQVLAEERSDKDTHTHATGPTHNQCTVKTAKSSALVRQGLDSLPEVPPEAPERRKPLT